MRADDFLDDKKPTASSFLDSDQPTGFKTKSLAELLSTYGDTNTLNQGAKVVSGLPGVLEVGARRGYAGIGKVEQGALSILGDLLNSEALRNASDVVGNRARQIENSAVLRGQKQTGFAPESIVNDIPEAGANAVSSVIQTAPSLLAGAVAPGAALPALFGQTFSQEYAQGKDAGLTPWKSTFRAVPMAAFEVAGEKLGGFDRLAEGLRKATVGNGVADLGSAMLSSALKEIPSEEFTTTGQFLTDKAPVIGINQDATLADYGQQVKDTALATALQSGAMGAGGRVLQRIAAPGQSVMSGMDQTQEVQAQPATQQINPDAIVSAISQATSNVKPSAAAFLDSDTTEAPNVSQPTQQPVTGVDPAAIGLQPDNGTGSPATELTQPNANAGGDSAAPNGALPASDISDGASPAQQPADLTQATNKESLPVAPVVNDSLTTQRGKKPKANTLLSAIDGLGGIDNKYKWDISGEQKFARGGYNKVFRNASTKTLEQHIENGDLDEFLPYDMRSTVTDDQTAGRDYLADRIRNGERVLPYDVELEAKQSKAYEQFNPQDDISAIGEDIDLDEINRLLSEAGYVERETAADNASPASTGQIENTQPQSPNSNVDGGQGTQRSDAREAVTANEVAGTLGSNEREGTRQQVETIVKRRAAANQIGKSKPFDNALKLAKEFMNGEDVSPTKFKNAAIMFASDKPLSEAFTALAEMAKAPARENRQSARSAMDVFTEQINNAKTADELKSISRNIQMETGVVSDAMAQQLDDMVMARIDALDNGGDLLGDNTAQKQAVADAESAKDAKRNAGDGNASDFVLTGSDRPADEAAARGAQDLFGQPAENAQANQFVEANKKVDESKPNQEKIEDFGEKIGGARKDVWSGFKDKMEQSMGEDVASVPLSKSWPEPDYQGMINSGADPMMVAYLRSLRDAVPVKPKSKWKVSGWASKTKALRDIAFDITKSTSSLDKLRTELNDFAKYARGGEVSNISDMADLYFRLGHEKSLKGIRVTVGQYSIYNGVEYKPAKTIWSVEKDAAATSFSNWPKQFATGSTKEEAISNFIKAFSSLDVTPPAARQVSFEIYTYKSKPGKFIIGKKVGKSHLDLKEFDNLKEAREYRANNQDALLEMLAKAKDIPSERNAENNPRVGADHRQGTDVTPQSFAETFGFRGVEFGNYVENDKRQQDLNEAYDALMDMAGVLSVPPKAISLNGELGIAFGARGSGGKRPAKAHYESGHIVINLTKNKGAGSLGHEWWHALDNYFSRMRNKSGDFTTEALDVSLSSRGSRYDNNTSVRNEMIDAFGGVVKAIRDSSLSERSKKLDKTRTKDYWSTMLEMTARSFESYLISKLQDQGASNDYLANIVTEEAWGMESSYPYPTAGEIPAIRAAYDNFFDVVQTKETDDGNVAMFKRDPMLEAIASLKQQQNKIVDEVQSYVDQVTKGWKNSPVINVVYDLNDTKVPQEIRDLNEEQEQGGATGTPSAFIFKNRVYIVASQMTSAQDVLSAVFHESLGHYGLRGVFQGKQAINAALSRVANMRSADVAKKAKQYGLDISKDADRLLAAEEVLAELAETRPEIGVVKQIIAAIRSWLRDNVPYFRNIELSDAEIIRDYILPARRFVENGGKEQGVSGLVSAFNRGDTNMVDGLLESAYKNKGISRLNGEYLVAKMDKNNRGIFLVNGNVDREVYGKILAEAKSNGLDAKIMYVYAKSATYTGASMQIMRLDDFVTTGKSGFSRNTIPETITVNGKERPTFQRKETDQPKRSMIRDELGRLKLPATDAASYIADKILNPITGKNFEEVSKIVLNKIAFGTAPKELRTMTRLYKADIQKAMEAASNVVKTMSPMSQLDRALVSDVVEKMVATGVTPPEHIVKIATGIQNAMDVQTDELVNLGMLSQDSADRWRGKYLPRFYMRENTEGINAWVGRMLRNSLPVRGIGGNSLKGRGLFEEVNVNEVPKFEALGWEVRDPLWKKNRQGELELVDENKAVTPEKVVVWRDWTPSERAEMGENRDALFRFVMGYTSMQNDIALGRLFDSIAKNQEWTRARASDGYVKVPDSEIPETGGVKRYGNLAGLYVKKEILDHISQYEEASELWKYYRKALSFWKAGKTVLNPVAHVNNVVSNLTMAHFAGVSYWDSHKYIAAIKDLAKNAPLVQEAKDRGLMTGDITRAELMADMPDDIKAMMEMQESAIKRKASTVFNIVTFGLSKPMGKAYRLEDDFFKYLIYRDARKNGLSPDDAVDYATKYIFTYDDLPKGARTVRDLAIPFFAYTYKAVPALTHTLLNYPWRFAAPAAAIGGINAIAYAFASGDDDWDWYAEAFKGSVNSSVKMFSLGFSDDVMKTKGAELEREERKNLPPWMQGRSALGTEKNIRLGTDEKNQLPVYMDVSRMIPGGDIFDVTNQADGVPVPAPIMPSNPILTTIAAMFWNKDTFTGKEVTDLNDTGAEAAKKRAEWLLRQISPGVAPTSYHADRLAEAVAMTSESTIETPWKDYTGYGKDGLAVQKKYAIPQTFGIKARPIDLERSAEISQGQDNKEIRSIMAEVRQAARLLDQKAISQREYDRRVSDAEAKIESIQSK